MNNIKIAVIGLGYVGLPLARLFATKYPVVGFDINQSRVKELKKVNDHTLEVEKEVLKGVLLDYNPTLRRDNSTTPRGGECKTGLYCTFDLEDIRSCNFYVVTVPTPVDKNNRPDLTPLIKASETVGKVIRKGDIVVYESTVYPGATEEDCIPVVEKSFRFNIQC